MRLNTAASYILTASLLNSASNAHKYVNANKNRGAYGISVQRDQALSSAAAAFVTRQGSLISPVSKLVSVRGGAESEDSKKDSGEEEAVEQLYLPGLLVAEVSVNKGPNTVSSDSTVSITAKKAKELGIASGDVVKIIGRRRRFSYVTVKVSKSVKGCRVSKVLAENLRLRIGDKLKIVPSEEGEVSVLMN